MKTRDFAKVILQKLRRNPELEKAVLAQPTISPRAMAMADMACFDIDEAMCDRIWSVTSIRNKHGEPHINDQEMRDLCDKVEAAAREAINGWRPAAPEGEK